MVGVVIEKSKNAIFSLPTVKITKPCRSQFEVAVFKSRWLLYCTQSLYRLTEHSKMYVFIYLYKIFEIFVFFECKRNCRIFCQGQKRAIKTTFPFQLLTENVVALHPKHIRKQSNFFQILSFPSCYANFYVKNKC